MTLREQVEQDFHTRFGVPPPTVVRAPGRVNLIGEHTDYNDGFVLPMAIDREVWIALRPREDGRVVVHSLDYGASPPSSSGRLRAPARSGASTSRDAPGRCRMPATR